MLDQQGNEIKIGVAYFYMFGHGDRTALVALEALPNGKVRTYDVHFKFEVEVLPEGLWRPLQHSWGAWKTDARAVIAYCGESALNLS